MRSTQHRHVSGAGPYQAELAEETGLRATIDRHNRTGYRVGPERSWRSAAQQILHRGHQLGADKGLSHVAADDVDDSPGDLPPCRKCRVNPE